MNGFYPVVLQLKGKRCVVIGGGTIAQRKLLGLLEAGADDVWAISPAFTQVIMEWAAAGKIRSRQGAYSAADLHGAWLVFAATDDRQVNEAVAADGVRLGIWVNAANESKSSSFISPSVVRRGDLLLSVTASGASPALSQQIKQKLAASYGPEYEHMVMQLRRLREHVRSTISDEQKRKTILKLAADEIEQPEHHSIDIDEWLQSLIHRTDRRHT
ncbi:bifunctional precorrin-2 dehydrogenase/sirohydrochlorin ferrochelatase [Paenibacillus sp. FSL H8-0548]|uniref:precorrin-2 dehydrogenase/sirohydrochlorin ferrochelatase family protein n=1 Tax=Paenibacillus sp. FSL H8-0548 TaxID=1920422 RepID=UPI00096C3E33|nr:bifunctional precorrin-2 dehydrogenase/sirohydrochlorin ferrochelatase [Paenibacillus sp. FSL H8-0548]